jgi:hypothetical protein
MTTTIVNSKKKRLAVRGALIVGGIVAGTIAFNAIKEIGALNGRVNFLEDITLELADINGIIIK